MPSSLTTLDQVLAVLTAMITPALLLSACGTFVLSTSNRLARVIDRVRRLSERFEALATGEVKDPPDLLEQRRLLVEGQLGLLSARAVLLQRALTLLYVAAGFFVGTSLGIAGVSVTEGRGVPGWLPVGLGLCGAVAMLAGCALLVVEARRQLRALRNEMAFLRYLVEYRTRPPQMPQG